MKGSLLIRDWAERERRKQRERESEKKKKKKNHKRASPFLRKRLKRSN